MKKVLLLFCLVELAALPAMAQPDSLDLGFGTNGRVNIPVGVFDDFANAVAVQADGKIVVAGYSRTTVLESGNRHDFSVARLNTDGTLDFSVVITVGALGGFANAIRIQNDGKILVAGSSFNTNGFQDYTVVRLMPDGSIDSDFGTNGRVYLSIGEGDDICFAMALQPDNKIVLAGQTDFDFNDIGFSVARLNSDGTPDPGFGDNNSGKRFIPVSGTNNDAVSSVAIQPDGHIVLAGTSRTSNPTTRHFSVVRLTTTGGNDPGFDTDGEKVLITINSSFCRAMVLQPDGKILLAGNSGENLNGFQVVRLTSNGSPDPGFSNTDGRVFVHVGTGVDDANSMALQTDGKIVVAGLSSNGSVAGFSAIRLNTNGVLDPCFNGDGKVIIPSVAGGALTERNRAMALQSDGKIILAGFNGNVNAFPTNPAIDFIVMRLKSGGSGTGQDLDGDGYSSCVDCSDDNQNVNPGATELCNGIDDNCNGQVDEGLTLTFYRDFDGDGFGSMVNTIQACTLPAGYVTNNTDCDDAKFLYLDSDGDGFGTGSPIECGVDNNTDCNDADIDIHATVTYYRDADGDGFGDVNVTSSVCQPAPPSGYVSNSSDCDDTKLFYADSDGDSYGAGPAIPCGGVQNNTDCNDNSTAINPEVLFDICNDTDDDCDGLVDEDSPKITIYVDNDNDTWGDASQSIQSCIIPPGYADRAGDCNDNNPTIRPNAPDICNGIDDNCDGIIDENVIRTFYFDNDKDGFGNASNQVQACIAPTGYTEQAGDCNDNDPTIKPSAPEMCNGIDDNCNGEVDENVKTIYYLDNDQDGYGNASASLLACSPPAGYVDNADDCNDLDFNIKPGATEICNGKDDDCNGQVDEPMASAWYLDADNDGYYTGDGVIQCGSPGPGYKTGLTDGGDCNDNNLNVNPGAQEICNGIDDDCNGQIDDGMNQTFYRDADGDGYGDPNNSRQGCMVGYVANNADCDDTNDTIHPNATEYCNGIDENCNGIVDDNPVLVTWYRDADGDGWGDPGQTEQACLPPAGYIREAFDCDDTDPTINPAAAEIDNDKDDDCDGQIDEDVLITYYRDADNDGFGDPSNSTQASTRPAGYVTNNSDCDDTNAAINPNTIWYLDADNDNYYTGSGITQCLSPGTGYKFSGPIAGGDCNDIDPAIHPGATEICNSIDDDCNGEVDDNSVIPTWYLDGDNDNYYTGAGVIQCNTPGTGYKVTGLSGGGDCNDNNGAIHPNATEGCNEVDDNCNAQIDEGVKTTFYRDADIDGFGDPNTTTQACAVPAGYVTDNTDCNDNNAAINPNTIWYLDFDDDNYFTGTGFTQCISPGTGYKISGLITGGDCNDDNPNINPGKTEICNGVDDNCNEQVDDGVTTTFYRDADTDGFGDPNTTTQACTVPTGYVTNDTDCNDDNAAINPNTIWFLDADNDNYYTGSTITQCSSPGTGYKTTGITAGGDCNDGNSNINPGKLEVCGNNLDDNCSGPIDEGCPVTPTLSINDIMVYESQGQAVLTISLSNPVARVLKVGFKTIDGTASKSKDYKNINGSITIAAGSLTAQVPITILPDNLNEGSEFFDVQISLPKIMGQAQPIVIGDAVGTVTILNGIEPAITLASKTSSNEKSSGAISESFKISAVPNPSQTDFMLRIEGNSMEPADIRIFDMQGRLVKQLRSVSTHLKFGSELRPGVYLVEVRQRANKKTMKLLKL